MATARYVNGRGLAGIIARPAAIQRAFINNPRVYSDYGSGDGDPKGERPQEQGKNPSVDKEHPGPPPPSTDGSAGQKGGSTKGETSQKQQSGKESSKAS